MTITEQGPADDTELTVDDLGSLYESPGFAGALATGDHKVLGRMYLFFGLTGGLLALVLSLLVALERVNISGLDILSFGSDNQYFQTWSLSRTSLLFFCVIPLFVGLATYVVPLQVGAPSIAFPRAAAAAFWTWLVGMGIHIATVFVDGGLGYPVLPEGFTAVQGPDPNATELSLLSIGIVVIAVLLAMVCIVSTVISQRPDGMTLYEVPLFSWSMLVAGGVWILALPVWLANLAIAWVDFRGSDALRYGNVTEFWDQIDWVFSQPMVFAFAIPLLGIVGEIVPVAAGKRQRMYSVQQSGIAAFGVFTFGAWAQPYFNGNVFQQPLFVVMSLLLAVPILAFAGGLADTMRKTKVTFSTHLGLALLALLALLAAAGVAALYVSGPAIGVLREIDDRWLKELIEPLEDLRGTVIATSVMQHVFMASVIGAIAGLYYWGPKIFGCRLNSGVGMLAGVALVSGTFLSGTTNIINGFLDEPDHVFRFDGLPPHLWDRDAVELFNIIGLIGAILLILGLSLVLLDLILSLSLGKGSDEDIEDPWGGHTLEWATPSPPPLGNFINTPEVTSERPLLDLREESGV